MPYTLTLSGEKLEQIPRGSQHSEDVFLEDALTAIFLKIFGPPKLFASGTKYLLSDYAHEPQNQHLFSF